MFSIEFPFPSNGKAYPKRTKKNTFVFKTKSQKFPFPSNGKAYPKNIPEYYAEGVG